jgi:hypothetical protein
MPPQKRRETGDVASFRFAGVGKRSLFFAAQRKARLLIA